MKKLKRFAPVIMAVLGVGTTIYTLETRVRAQVILPTPELSATVAVKYYSPSGALGMTETWTRSLMSNGSSALVRLTKNDTPDETRIVLDTSKALWTTIDPKGESITTYRSSPAEIRGRSMVVPGCNSLPAAGTLLGYPVVLWHLQKTAGPREINEERWLAPSLGCFTMKRSYTVSIQGGPPARTTDEVTSLTVGHPDASLFAIPANYVERSPSEAMSERASREGKACSRCASMQAIDSVYSSRHP